MSPETRASFLQRLGKDPVNPMPEAQPQAFPAGWQWQYARQGPFVTPLNPQQETMFQQWVQTHSVPFNPASNSDYDMRGFWLALQQQDPRAVQSQNPNDKRMHFPDYWKTPYHESFSRESKYANPNAPTWVGNRLMDQNGNIVFDEPAVYASRQRGSPKEYIPVPELER